MSDPLGIPALRDAVRIGGGGFGVVYRAYSDDLGCHVAVKVLADRVDDDTSRRRFAWEGRILESLAGHPHIVAVHGSGVNDVGRPYLLMDHVAGGSLDGLLADEGRLEWPDAIRIGVQLCGALATAHALGILHRDVQPENVLMSSQGEPLLADFGVAKVGGASSRTTAGAVVGTVLHTAPEVLGGQRATEASDVYSLASTIQTLLIGSAPFSRTSDQGLQAVIGRIFTQPAPDLRPYGVPADVCAVLERALSKAPGERPPTAAALGTDLQAVEAAHGLPTTPMVAPAGSNERAAYDVAAPVGRRERPLTRPVLVAVAAGTALLAALTAWLVLTVAGDSRTVAHTPIATDRATTTDPAPTTTTTTATTTTSTTSPASTTAPPTSVTTTVGTTVPPSTLPPTTAPVQRGPTSTTALSRQEALHYLVACDATFYPVAEGGTVTQTFRAELGNVVRVDLLIDDRGTGRGAGSWTVALLDGTTELVVTTDVRMENDGRLVAYLPETPVSLGHLYTVRATNLSSDGRTRALGGCPGDDYAAGVAALSGDPLVGDLHGAVVGLNDVVR